MSDRSDKSDRSDPTDYTSLVIMPEFPQAIFFDLDDTIISYSPWADFAWREICRQYAPRVNKDAEMFYQHVSTKARWFWNDPERHQRGRADMLQARNDIITAVLRDYAIDDPPLCHEFALQRTVLHEESLTLFPGARETLQQLCALGIPLALITNGAQAVQQAKIDRFELEQYFNIILIEGSFGIGKPDVRIFQHAMDHIPTPAEQTWMIGDHLLYDILPANQLGMITIWNDYRGKGLPSNSVTQPAHTIRSIVEVIELLS